MEDFYSEAVITRDDFDNWYWRPQATGGGEILRLQVHSQNYPRYRRWEHVAFAFDIPDHGIMVCDSPADHRKVINNYGNILELPTNDNEYAKWSVRIKKKTWIVRAFLQQLLIPGWGGYSQWWLIWGGSARKGFFFRASSNWKGSDVTCWSTWKSWKGREICHFGRVKLPACRRRLFPLLHAEKGPFSPFPRATKGIGDVCTQARVKVPKRPNICILWLWKCRKNVVVLGFVHILKTMHL